METPEDWEERNRRKKAENPNLGTLHKQLGTKVLEEQSPQGWWTPQVQDSKHSGTNPSANGKRDLLVNQVGAVQKQWATPIMGDSHLASTPEVAAKRLEEGKVTLSRQMAAQVKVESQWGSPRTGIRGETHFSYDRGKHNIEEQAGASMKGGGKLNPRWVETLMGLPVGWTMPSCASPLTIAPTSFDCSATELSQQPQP